MVLTIHIGSHIITLSVYDEKMLCATAALGADLLGTPDQYAVQIMQMLHLHKIDTDTLTGAVISSVVPRLTDVLRQAALLLCKNPPLMVGAGIKTGLNLRLDNTSSVGSDFICTAVAALAEFAPPLIIVHLDSASTFTAINSDGVLIGRSILPGIETSVAHLCESSAQLPEVTFHADAPLFGRSTAQAVHSGAFYGALSMVEGMLARYRAQLGIQTLAVLTGGSAPLLSDALSDLVIYRPGLLQDGLRILFSKNR